VALPEPAFFPCPTLARKRAVIGARLSLPILDLRFTVYDLQEANTTSEASAKR